MGQSPSRSGGIKSGRRRSIRSPFPRRSKLSSSSLSHTFSITTINENVELLNINTASEEQLMTLPGITRQISQAIVDHRQAIGRFKRVDDLALVSGMGAVKLNEIRGEITVNRKVLSNSSSRTQSLDSIRSSDSGRTPIEINSVKIFQLQCIPGLNQELAANIIDYRNKKGPFKSLDDLIKVKGIDVVRLSSIKSQIVCKTPKQDFLDVIDKIDGSMNSTNGHVNTHLAKTALLNGNTGPKVTGHRKSLSMPIKYNPQFLNGFSLAPVNDIFDLLSAYSRRPIIEEEFNYLTDGKPAFRIATWNLHVLSVEKANNPGFREVVCRTLLENRFSILAIQDVVDEEALRVLCDELNMPTLRRVNEWKENSRQWRFYVTDGYIEKTQKFGFLYDAFSGNIPIEIYRRRKLEDNIKNRNTSEDDTNATNNIDTILCPNINYTIIDFRIAGKKFFILNLHFVHGNSDYNNTLLCETIDKLLNISVNVVVVGDVHTSKNVEDLASCYKSVINPECSTLVEPVGAASNVSGMAAILVPGEELASYTGECGVVRSGLCHLAIPRGWTWGGHASPHCPVWASFYAC